MLCLFGIGQCFAKKPGLIENIGIRYGNYKSKDDNVKEIKARIKIIQSFLSETDINKDRIDKILGEMSSIYFDIQNISIIFDNEFSAKHSILSSSNAYLITNERKIITEFEK